MEEIKGNFIGCLLLLTTALAVINAQTYHYGSSPSSWSSVKRVCDCRGNIVILDTLEKQTRLLDSGIIQAGKCAWIGASTYLSGQYKWIELPPNYDQSSANGRLLTDTYNNFLQGSVPENSGGWPGVCIFPNGTWVGTTNNNNGGHVCEWTECGPGMYKGKKTVSSNVYCSNQVDSCLPCPGTKIKSISGDSSHLCQDVCDGATNVANVERTACECAAGYYGSGPTCTACSGNTIKPSQGDAPTCHIECDPSSSQPNLERTDCVCNAGYYRDGSGCLLCTDNNIKVLAGNAPYCDTDPPCDGIMTAPNQNHTACECNAGYYGNITNDCSLCPNNLIKPDRGYADSCDTECTGLTEPNTERTECICKAGYYGDGSSCTMCAGNTIKPTAGNTPNCDVTCDGMTTVPNQLRTACECKAGYYGNGSISCVLCPDNKIKPDRGDALDCFVECPTFSEPNDDHTECVCSPGYYNTESGCTLCTGNTIKRTAGDTPCDTTCDGVTNVPNANHTDCECNVGHYDTNGACAKCTGNTIKTNVGNTSDCNADPACDGTMKVTNDQHTECVCDFGLYENGSTCSQCMNLNSGSGGTSLIDRDSATCSLVPFQTNATVSLHYDLSIHRNCTHPHVKLFVAVDNSTTCEELRDVLFTEKQGPGCNGINTYFGLCDVINENQSDGKRICAVRCKYAEVADQCKIHILSGITPKDMHICEIMTDKIVDQN